jgi:hypothetical protein
MLFSSNVLILCSIPVDVLIDATHRYLNNAEVGIKHIFGDRFDDLQIFYSTPERYTQCKYVDLVNTREHDASLGAFPEFKKQITRDNIETLQQSFNPADWKVKRGDFFPYADCDHCYWTGFFSSRQGLKRLERVGSSFLHAARQIESIVKLEGVAAVPGTEPAVKPWNESPLYALDDAMGVAQHHDAVSGKLQLASILDQAFC